MFMWKVDAIRTKGLYVPEAVIERADVSNFITQYSMLNNIFIKAYLSMITSINV